MNRVAQVCYRTIVLSYTDAPVEGSPGKRERSTITCSTFTLGYCSLQGGAGDIDCCNLAGLDSRRVSGSHLSNSFSLLNRRAPGKNIADRALDKNRLFCPSLLAYNRGNMTVAQQFRAESNTRGSASNTQMVALHIVFQNLELLFEAFPTGRPLAHNQVVYCTAVLEGVLSYPQLRSNQYSTDISTLL